MVQRGFSAQEVGELLVQVLEAQERADTLVERIFVADHRVAPEIDRSLELVAAMIAQGLCRGRLRLKSAMAGRDYGSVIGRAARAAWR
ncbi:hypothetical protein AZKH_0668 [Azoarcus sp. KH32C]|nr:hypothetical protein AZKH_0668 [Azoarcus sp. KH32C]